MDGLFLGETLSLFPPIDEWLKMQVQQLMHDRHLGFHVRLPAGIVVARIQKPHAGMLLAAERAHVARAVFGQIKVPHDLNFHVPILEPKDLLP